MLAVALFTAAMSSMLGVGSLSAKFGGFGGLFLFSWTQLIALLLLCSVTELGMLYVTAFIFGLGYGGILPTYPVIVREYLHASTAGRRTALVVLFGSIGMAIGAGLGGVSHDLAGDYTPAFVVGVIFNVFNLVLVAYLGGKRGVRNMGASSPATA